MHMELFFAPALEIPSREPYAYTACSFAMLSVTETGQRSGCLTERTIYNAIEMIALSKLSILQQQFSKNIILPLRPGKPS